MICVESVQSLISKNKDDNEILRFIEECLLSFSEYHSRIYNMETWVKLFGYHNMSKEDYQNKFAELDQVRSNCHNAVISNISILNRLCSDSDIPLVYEGIVSKQQPHRVEIAEAVLAYVDETIKLRKK